jgi:hypothetical protein
MRRAKPLSIFSVLAALGIIVLTLAACNVATSMHVRSGVDPRNLDDDVRFRTTYYFRVFDFCEGRLTDAAPPERDDTVLRGKVSGPYQVKTDSLYRFRMTGKGYSLFQRIHFESGTLRREQIDPFGSNVEFDSRINRFVYKSREETQEEARRESRLVDVERLRKLRDSFPPEDHALRAEVDGVIEDQIRALRSMPVARGAVERGRMAADWDVLRQVVASLEDEIDAVVTALKETAAHAEDLGNRQANMKPSLVTASTRLQAALKALEGVRAGRATRETAVAAAAKNAQATVDQAHTAAASLKGKTTAGDAEFAATGAYGKAAAEYSAAAAAAADAYGTARTGLTTALREAAAAADEVARLRRSGAARDDGAIQLAAMEQEVDTVAGRIRRLREAGDRAADRMIARAAGARRIAGLESESGDADEATLGTSGGSLSCAGGTSARRGFQILGPEGWRTFDQDERLLMAMSSSAKPLIGTLQELSKNVLNAQQSPADALLPLVSERLRITEAVEVLKRYEESNAGTIPDMLRAVLEAFEGTRVRGGEQ